MFYDGVMIFVRWHYRNGVYVCSHLRRRHSRPGPDQTLLLPALLPRRADEPLSSMRTAPQDRVPVPLLPGQRTLPIPAIS